MKVYILATLCESFTAIGPIVLEILCVEPIYPQYSEVLETCLALRYCFFEVLGSESVKVFRENTFLAKIYESTADMFAEIKTMTTI